MKLIKIINLIVNLIFMLDFKNNSWPSGAVPVRQSAVVQPFEPSSTKKADVIDLTLESSSDDEEESDPPLKKRCVYMSKAEEIHSKGFVVINSLKLRLPFCDHIFISKQNLTMKFSIYR